MAKAQTAKSPAELLAPDRPLVLANVADGAEGLIIADLRGLKQVNLALGQHAGDDLLRRVASALKSNLRNNDVLARYYGDRFAVLLPEISSDGLAIVLGKLWQSLQAMPSPVASETARVQADWASVGLFPALIPA